MWVQDLIPTSTRVKTRQGFLLVSAAISRSGIQGYRAGQIGMTDRDPTEVVKVYRPPEEVFADGSMASFGRVPVTNNHPGGGGVVTLDNVDSLSVGMSDPEVVRDGDLMQTKLLITNKKAIADVEGGKNQLSNGYHAEFDIGPGTTPGGEFFDAVQRDIKGNHIAIVASGRGGARVAIADKGDGTVKLTIDGKEFEVDQAVANELKKVQGDAEAALKLVSDAEEETEKKKKEAEDAELEAKNKKENPDLKNKKTADAALTKEVETLKAQLDATREKIPTTDQLDARADERATVLDTARRLVTDIDTAGKSNEVIRSEVVAKLCTYIDVKDVSEDYITATFDGLAVGGGESARWADRNLTGPGVNDADLNAGQKARMKYVSDTEGAWDTSQAPA